MNRRDRSKVRLGSGSKGASPQDESNADTETARRKEKEPDRQGYASKVIVDVVPQLLKKHNEERGEDSRHSKRQLLWTIAAAVLVFAYTVASFWQVCETRRLVKTAHDTFDLTNRAYVGIDSAVPMYYRDNGNNEGRPQPEGRTLETVTMRFQVNIKNFGTVPGFDFDARWDPRINGKALITDQPLLHRQNTIFPGQNLSFTYTLGTRQYQAIASGMGTLQTNVWIEYSSAGHRYSNCDREQYNFDGGSFMDLGETCDQPWAKGPQVSP
jgi:hypothetical protein